MSAQHRKAFDDLVIEIMPDHGPVWLEQLIWAKERKVEPDPAAKQAMERAIAGLEHIAHNW